MPMGALLVKPNLRCPAWLLGLGQSSRTRRQNLSSMVEHHGKLGGPKTTRFCFCRWQLRAGHTLPH